MPYKKSDYPDSMKNLDKVVRIKAIDILNAMLTEGYKEDSAIPISIAGAKDWEENASKDEKDKLLKKDITNHQKTSDSARLQDANVRVSYDKDKEQWSVKSVGAKQVDSYHGKKSQAMDRAKEITDNRRTQLLKEKKND